jgi:hypothetical protein
MKKWNWIAVAILAGFVGAGVVGGLLSLSATMSAQTTGTRVFELRTYTAQPGKFEAMKARFRQHILPLFKKHNLELVAFWTYADPPGSENTLVYVLAHPSRAAAATNWKAFIGDPERLKVWAETEKDGPINLKVDSVYLNAFDASPIK